ncbi:MAG: adenine deaminase, partial [Rhizobiaceae bacterium]
MSKSAATFLKLKPWTDVAPTLVDVAMGRKPADMVVRAGRWVNVHSGEIIPDTDLAIIEGRFAYCGSDASHCIGPNTKVIEAGGRYLVPGLCDGHM